MVNAQGTILLVSAGGALVLMSFWDFVEAFLATDTAMHQRDLFEGFGLLMTGISLCMLAGMIAYPSAPLAPGWYGFVAVFLLAAVAGLITVDNAHRTYRHLARVTTPTRPPT